MCNKTVKTDVATLPPFLNPFRKQKSRILTIFELNSASPADFRFDLQMHFARLGEHFLGMTTFTKKGTKATHTLTLVSMCFVLVN